MMDCNYSMKVILIVLINLYALVLFFISFRYKNTFKESDLKWISRRNKCTYELQKNVICSTSLIEEYGFNSIYLMPVNMYGPYDKFNDQTSHVIPVVIKNTIC